MRLSGRVILVQGIVFLLGSVVMGYEMLASRYLFPYFGGSIGTWGALISTVLAALMFGYSSWLFSRPSTGLENFIVLGHICRDLALCVRYRFLIEMSCRSFLIASVTARSRQYLHPSC